MKKFFQISAKVAAIVLALTPAITFSQTLNLNQFGIEEGLPQSSIYTMLQDKDGNIWVGTMNGVSRYNGLNFENYSKKDGLSENRVTSSFLDSKGNIWLGHWSGGISKRNVETGQFEDVNTGNVELKKTINCILEDKNGTVWFGTDGQGLVKFQDGQFSIVNDESGLASNNVYALMQDKNGVLWIGTSGGITQFSGSFKAYEGSLPSALIRSFLTDSKGNVWIGTQDRGVVKVSADGDSKTYSTTDGLPDAYIRVIFEDVNGSIFLGTWGGGVAKYLPQLEANNYQGPIFQTISSSHGLSNDRVLSIIQDREKNIWIGTYLNLNQYFDEQFEIYGNSEGLENSLVWSVIQDKKGNYWIGTEGGLFRFILDAYASGTAKSSSSGPRYKFERIFGASGNDVLNTSALYEDVKGNIWFTNFARGLSRYNPATGKTDHYDVAKSGLPVNEIYSIAGDKTGNIWIGTNKGGLLRFDIETEKFEQFTSAKDGLGSDQIYAIYRDSKDRMWFGCLSGALSMYDPTGGDEVKFKTFGEADGYPSKFTLCVTEDEEGKLWFGTFDLGIYSYDGSKFNSYTTKDGLSSNTPFLLSTDDRNNLWIGTGLGVDRMNLKDGSIKHYEKEDGFLGVEINPNAVCRDNSGNLWFGSIIGLVRYNSKNEKNNEVEPITSVSDPRLFFEHAELPADRVFSWFDNHFTFDFVGTSLTNPKRVRYKYMLAGLDTTWSPVTRSNSVTYPDLKPGQYTFMVKSANNDGVWNAEPATYTFTITPPFWQTTWFWAVSGVTGLLLIFLFIKWREAKLKKENQILERKVEERTETIRQQNVELEKKNEKITDSIDYAKRIQQAVFVSKQEIEAYPFESFLFFKPVEIVSGDFYWSHKKSDHEYYFTVADCTGHGVPGAFMSLIGYNMLNHTVKDMNIEKPSKVLDTMRSLIRQTLTAGGADERAMKDGIAIAFCRIDTRNMKLEFAGSYNPIYLLRNGQIEEYKAERYPIGHVAEGTGQSGSFVDQTIDLQKGDIIYLFSDGFPDQTGGPKKRKYFYGPFKNLLQSIHQLPMDQQKAKLNETIESWMAGREQLDDITVVGLKF